MPFMGERSGHMAHSESFSDKKVGHTDWFMPEPHAPHKSHAGIRVSFHQSEGTCLKVEHRGV